MSNREGKCPWTRYCLREVAQRDTDCWESGPVLDPHRCGYLPYIIGDTRGQLLCSSLKYGSQKAWELMILAGCQADDRVRSSLHCPVRLFSVDDPPFDVNDGITGQLFTRQVRWIGALLEIKDLFVGTSSAGSLLCQCERLTPPVLGGNWQHYGSS